jgi:Lar family restriction alleviation protein
MPIESGKIRHKMGEDAKKGDAIERHGDGLFYPVKPVVLKRCPFCGSGMVLPKPQNEASCIEITVGKRVHCHECGAMGPGAESSERAMALWNKRGLI